ncbi:hypothetical protein [Microbacterium lacticum]
MLGMPAEVVAGISERTIGEVLGIQIFWSVLLAAFGILLWRRGLRRYTSVGA